MLEALRAMREVGYTQDDLQEVVRAALEHIDGEVHEPYTFRQTTTDEFNSELAAR